MSSSFTNLLRQAILLILLAVPAAFLTGLLHPRAPAWEEIPLKPGEVELQTAMEWENVLWVDARGRLEYEEGHIPGALLLNEDEWEGLFFDFMAVWDPEQNIVVYCGSTQCQASQHVAERLRVDLGSDRIYVLKDGWKAWSRRTQQ